MKFPLTRHSRFGQLGLALIAGEAAAVVIWLAGAPEMSWLVSWPQGSRGREAEPAAVVNAARRPPRPESGSPRGAAFDTFASSTRAPFLRMIAVGRRPGEPSLDHRSDVARQRSSNR